MKRKGAEYGGRWKGVRDVPESSGLGDSSLSFLFSASLPAVDDLAGFADGGARKRMADGSTVTMSPGARRVLQSSCWNGHTMSAKENGRLSCTHFLSVQFDTPVDDKTSSLIHRMSKAAAEDEDVYPSLNFQKH
jgi:hypothetical protein